MTHVSRKKLNPSVHKSILDAFVYVLTHTKDENSMRWFLDAFLTNTEKLMLAKRLAIVYLLSERVGEKEIANTLGVTQATVSRTKLWAETKGTGYKVGLNKIREKRLLLTLKDLSLKALGKAIRYAGGRY